MFAKLESALQEQLEARKKELKSLENNLEIAKERPLVIEESIARVREEIQYYEDLIGKPGED